MENTVEDIVTVEGTVMSVNHLFPIENSETLSVHNFITGIANLGNFNPDKGICNNGLQGNNAASWKSFYFHIDAGRPVSQAVVSVSLLGISGNSSVNNLNYAFKDITTSIDSENNKKLTVNGQVLIGAPNTYLCQLSYMCAVAYE